MSINATQAWPKLDRRHLLAAIAVAGAGSSIVAASLNTNAGVTPGASFGNRLRSISVNATPLASHVVRLRLSPGTGNNWCFYNGSLVRSSENRESAVIISVRNVSEEPVKLTFRSEEGDHAGPALLSGGHASSEFRGLTLRGLWTAEVSGTEADAPAAIVLDIAFELRDAQPSATPSPSPGS
jgi:hypothetical protein